MVSDHGEICLAELRLGGGAAPFSLWGFSGILCACLGRRWVMAGPTLFLGESRPFYHVR